MPVLFRLFVWTLVLIPTVEAALLSTGFLTDPAGDQASTEYGGDLRFLSVTVDSLTGVEFSVGYTRRTFLPNTVTFIHLDTDFNPATGQLITELDRNIIGADYVLLILPLTMGGGARLFTPFSPLWISLDPDLVEYSPSGIKLTIPLESIGGNPYFNFKVSSRLALGAPPPPLSPLLLDVMSDPGLPPGTTVPEPSSVLLFLSAIAALAMLRRHQD